MANHNITVTLTNCVADADNPKTIADDSTAELLFTAIEGFPYNSFTVSATNATATPVVSDDKKSVTVTLSAPSGAVKLSVAATITDNDINDKYEVKDGVMYRLFNNRTVCKWNPRWCRENL